MLDFKTIPLQLTTEHYLLAKTEVTSFLRVGYDWKKLTF